MDRVAAVFPRLNLVVRFRAWMRFLVLVWPAAISMSGFSLCAESISPTTHYSFDVWQTEDGLPEHSVTAIVQTRDGYLWFGTYNGLVRFDGVRFKIFDTSNTPQLTSSRVTSLLEDADGNLWIGHETGDLTKFRNGSFSHVNLGDAAPGGQIIGIGTDAEGTLWLLNSTGLLFSLKGSKIAVSDMSSPTGPNVPSLTKDRHGKLWVVRAGLHGWLEHGELAPWMPDGNPNTDYYERACASRSGGLWLVGNQRVFKWSGSGPVKDMGPAPWGENSVTAMLEAKSGDLLAGTLTAGLFVLSPDGTHRQFSRQNGLSHDWVRSLCEDREGNIWVGTGGGGLNALRERTVEMMKAPDDWQGRVVQSITPSGEGGLWVGTEGAGLYRVQEGIIKPFDETNGLLNPFIWSVLEDPQGRLLAGTWGKGLFVRQGSGFQIMAGMQDRGAAVPALYLATNGTLWAGTDLGLVRYEGGNCTWFTRQDGLVLPDVRAITEDVTGAIWFGMSGGGLGRFKEGKITQFRKPDGLASDFVWSLLAEKDGALWIGTFGGGLCRLKDGRFATVSLREGLPNNVICHIADDGRGSFWMSSYGGIFRVPKAKLNSCADGELKSIDCFTYGKAEGLSTLECSGGFEPSGCATPDGRLWFPTSKGLAVVNPADVKNNPLPPPIAIEEIIVDGQPASMSEAGTKASTFRLQIPPGKQRIEFRYTGLSLVAPHKVRFRYRLEGLEPDWVEAGTQRVAIYSYLKPGDYTFHATACNNDGVWNESGVALGFTILPRFWQTWWFSLGAILAGAGVVAGVARYITRRRLRRKMERLERQQALEKERARIAKDIHDDLGASLTRIILLSQSGRAELEDPHQAAADLDQIYLTARTLTRALDEIVWALSPQHDTLDSLVTYLGKFAQDFLSAAGIRCRLDVPMQLPACPLTAEVRHNLFLSFKEALHNVVKHASASEVRVSLTVIESGFALLFEDNGKGFDPARIAATPKALAARDPLRTLTGYGLVNIRKRLEEIDGVFELQSAPGEGTHLKFVVNVKEMAADGRSLEV